ncbi:hypothetical protein LCGC14_0941940 [marine sediment metagenome]|uniref:Uncharacterized protein n=1 Tax=marine sediment metagenome TaxID=412755 RepID=A0A0F9NJW3_9ZZZZ
MTDLAYQIYKILVEHAGANTGPTRDMFLVWFVEESKFDLSREFRFQGSLGFGGKFWRNGRFYVTCYSEDETPERMATIERTNDALSILNTTEA